MRHQENFAKHASTTGLSENHGLRRPGHRPSWARRGGRDIKKNIAKLPLMERTGWWFKIKRKCF